MGMTKMKKTGAELIAQERLEQIHKHGFDETSDEYEMGELIGAALFALDPFEDFEDKWPYGWHEHFKQKIINKTRTERLIVAGALIAAEIDRLNRLS